MSAIAEPPAAPVATPAPATATTTAMPTRTALPANTVPLTDPKTDRPAKAGSVQQQMNEELRARAKKAAPVTPAATPPKDDKPAPVAEKKPADAPKTDVEDEGDAEELHTIVSKEGEDGKEAGAKPKVNPWKLVEEHKTARAKLESEIVELRKAVPNQEALKAQQAEVESIRARNKELEEHIAFVDYTKSEEFQKDYQKPYEKAWTRAMKELHGVTVVDDATGSERNVEPSDLLALVNAKSAKAARALAEEMFGESASDVMEQRNVIRELFDSQTEHLEEMKSKGVERLKEKQSLTDKETGELHNHLKEAWEKANEAILADGRFAPYLKPSDGDDQGNAMLENGFKFVDEALATSPTNPKLTAEQRARAVRMHAAIRNRAAAFNRMRHIIETERKAHEETRKRLLQYEDSVPETRTEQKADTAASPRKGSVWSQVTADLHKIVKK